MKKIRQLLLILITITSISVKSQVNDVVFSLDKKRYCLNDTIIQINVDVVGDDDDDTLKKYTLVLNWGMGDTIINFKDFYNKSNLRRKVYKNDANFSILIKLFKGATRIKDTVLYGHVGNPKILMSNVVNSCFPIDSTVKIKINDFIYNSLDTKYEIDYGDGIKEILYNNDIINNNDETYIIHKYNSIKCDNGINKYNIKITPSNGCGVSNSIYTDGYVSVLATISFDLKDRIIECLNDNVYFDVNVIKGYCNSNISDCRLYPNDFFIYTEDSVNKYEITKDTFLDYQYNVKYKTYGRKLITFEVKDLCELTECGETNYKKEDTLFIKNGPPVASVIIDDSYVCVEQLINIVNNSFGYNDTLPVHYVEYI